MPPPVNVTTLFMRSTTLLPSVTFRKNVPVLLIVPHKDSGAVQLLCVGPTSVNCPCEAPSSVAPFDAGVSKVPPAFVSVPPRMVRPVK